MFECGKMRSRKIVHYIGIILAVFLLAGVLFCVRYLVQSKGAWVIVTLDGREISRYSSMADGIYRIEGRGKDYNVLVIEDGKASIKEANCQKHRNGKGGDKDIGIGNKGLGSIVVDDGFTDSGYVIPKEHPEDLIIFRGDFNGIEIVLKTLF